MSEDCPETGNEFDTSRFTSAQKLRRAECFCSRATLDDLLSDKGDGACSVQRGLRAG
jgi:hypothetical protein